MTATDSMDRAGAAVLAIAAAGLASSVAVASGGRVLAVREHKQPHGQAEALLPMIDAAMQAVGLPPSAIGTVVAEIGPGSFTGIRAGLAAARGIALATGATLVGITGFEAAAAGFDGAQPGPLLVGLESRREDLFVQLFDAEGEPFASAAAVPPAELAAWLAEQGVAAPLAIAGDAAERTAGALGGWQLRLQTQECAAVLVLRAAERRRARGRPDHPARPFYLRPPDVSLPPGRG